jgi:chromosome segregation ATPase
MFGAIFRWIKALGYLVTGQLDAARRTLDMNPHVMRAKYDEVLREKTGRIHQYKQAVSGLIAQQENKIEKVKTLTDDVKRLEGLKAGALAKAKQKVQQLQAAGKSTEEIQRDEEYMRCQSAFKDFSSTLAEKQARIEELETDIGDYGKRIAEHKVQMQSLLRELDKLKAEQVDAVADVITAREEKELAETVAGIAKDGTAEELQRLRQLRQEVKAEARVTKELAGTDTRAQEAEFLEYARSGESNSEFDALIGLASTAEKKAPATPAKETDKPSGLPE